MAADVDIANLALGRIGHKQRLSSINDTGVVAAHCRNLYPQKRDEILQSIEWPWAERIQALAGSQEQVPGWGYIYQKPVDCLTLKAVCDEGGARLWSRSVIGRETSRQQLPSEPYRLFDSDYGTLVATDVADAYGCMTWRITNTARFPPLFVSALAWAMAVDLGPLLMADQKTIGTAVQMWQAAMREAAAASLNEEGADQTPDARAIRARG